MVIEERARQLLAKGERAFVHAQKPQRHLRLRLAADKERVGIFNRIPVVRVTVDTDRDLRRRELESNRL